jgi:hypothetical protein
MNLDESQPHDHEWTVEIVCYSDLSTVAATTTEDPIHFSPCAIRRETINKQNIGFIFLGPIKI